MSPPPSSLKFIVLCKFSIGVSPFTTWEYWTLSEFERFYNTLESIFYKAYFRLLFFSGARHGEQRALTWRDIHFEEGYINIDKTNYNGQVHKPKTKTSKRRVYIPRHVIDDLIEYKEWYKNNYPYKDDYVVFGSFFQSVGETTIAKRYDAFVKETDLKRIKIHEFRHSHASDCINRLRMDRETLAKRLGHSSSITIERVYGHLYPSTEKIHFQDCKWLVGGHKGGSMRGREKEKSHNHRSYGIWYGDGGINISYINIDMTAFI